MKKVKYALQGFLGYDAVLEWDYDGTTISGMNDTIFVTIRTPKDTVNKKWSVSVYPRVCVELKAKMEERAKQLQDIALYQMLAEKDPAMKDLLNRYSSLPQY